MIRPVFFTGMLLIAGLSACSTNRMTVGMITPLLSGQYEAVNEEADLGLADRAIPAGIKMMEGLLKADPENIEILTYLAEGLCNYAFSFVGEKEPERASALYLRGRDYAARAMALKGGPTGLPDLGLDRFEEGMASVPENAMPGLYWTGRCWAGWLMFNLDDLEALAAISKLEIMMKKVLEWDESFDFAGPHLFFGAFYASRPKMLGGNTEKSRTHFDRAIELTHKKFLMAKVLYAKLYAVRVQDRKLYDRLLTEVVKASADSLPERRLANEVAKARAKELLEVADDFF